MATATRVRANDPDEDIETDEPETDNDSGNDEGTPVAKRRGRPKGSTNAAKKLNKPVPGITLTKRGIPKKVYVTHVTANKAMVVSHANPDMDPVRLNLNSVKVFDAETFEQMESRGEKISTLIDQNFGLLNQLEQLNAPKRGAIKVFDPAEEL